MRFHLPAWEKVTSNPWVLQNVLGHLIELRARPYQSREPKQLQFRSEEKMAIDNEISGLLEKGVIEPCTPSSDQFVSTIFLRLKKSGKFRTILNLKSFNKFVQYFHFKQETFEVTLELVEQGDFFTSIDLKDAYHSIPIAQVHRKYLRFRWRDKLLQYTCLPFGISSAPRVFTKTLKPVYSAIRSNGIRCGYFIDDSLVMNQCRGLCSKQTGQVMSVLDALGFHCNLEKSVIEPTQVIHYLGFIVDSASFTVTVSQEKVNTILISSQEILESAVVTIRDVARLIGLYTSCMRAIQFGPLYYRALENDKVMALKASGDYDAIMNLSEPAIQDIEWWMTNIARNNGTLIRRPPIDICVYTDASCTGWGGWFGNRRANGRWSEAESSRHINELELLAVLLALKALGSKEFKGKHIQAASDSMTAVCYINRPGGTKLNLNGLAKQIHMFASDESFVVSARFVHGSTNIGADFLSRNIDDSKDWMLDRSIFRRLCLTYFCPDIDLFANRINCQLGRYASWGPDPEACLIDCFSCSWTNMRPYCFPPFRLISKVLAKVTDDKVKEALLVVPHWQGQSWFPRLLRLLVELPASLPRHRDLLKLPGTQKHHPLGRRLKLVGCVISGQPYSGLEFRAKLPGSLPGPGSRLLANNMNTRGSAGVFGATDGVRIPFRQLLQEF